MGGSPGDVSEKPVTQEKLSKLSVTSPTSQLILQPFRRFTYVTAHSPTLPLPHLRHSSFSNPSFAFLRHRLFTYVTWRAAHDVFKSTETCGSVVMYDQPPCVRLGVLPWMVHPVLSRVQCPMSQNLILKEIYFQAYRLWI